MAQNENNEKPFDAKVRKLIVARDLDTLQAIVVDGAKKESKTQRLNHYLSVLRVISLEIDFDQSFAQAYMNISPGGSYPAGISPSSIKEEDLRKKYEEKIKKNQTIIFHKGLLRLVKQLNAQIQTELAKK